MSHAFAPLAGLKVAGCVLLCSLSFAFGAAGVSTATEISSSPRSPDAAPSGRASSSAANPWLAYATSVLPGSALEFGSARVGFALSWRPTEGLDENLASPAGVVLAWPSERVLMTRDDGRRWSRSLSAYGGFWGVDALDANRAWAVGVTGLYQTTDGGAQWRSVGEPGQTLVRVAFSTPTNGFGLTVAGELFVSHNAGRSWQAGRWAGRGEALCATSLGVLIAGENGAIWRSGNGGRSWQQLAGAYRRLNGFSAWYSDLSCDGADQVEVSQAFCMSMLEICGTEVVSDVRQSTDQAPEWRLVVSQHAAEPTAGGVHTEPASAIDTPLDRSAGSGAGSLCLFGYPFQPPASAAISCTTRATRPYREAVLPALSLPAKRSYVAMRGADFIDDETGWVMVDEYTGAAQPSGADARTEIWTTHDSGRRWHVTYVSPIYHGFSCANPERSTCWRSPL